MADHGRFADDSNFGAGAELRKANSPLESSEVKADAKTTKASRARYPDMQSAVRFPIKLPVSVKSKSGDNLAETQNISANGVLFAMERNVPVGSIVDFTIMLPAEAVGARNDVQVDCRGRVVRAFEVRGRLGVGVVIDEYHFERA